MLRLATLGAAFAAVLALGAPAAAAPGNLDNGFGSGGALMLSVGNGGQSAGNGVALGPGGALRVAGEAIDGNQSKFAFLRLDANAAPASLGSTFTSIGGDAAGAAIVSQPDGRSVVAGYGFGASGNDFALARYLDDGSLDTAGFGSGGTQQAALGAGNDSAARAVAPYGTDMLVAAGQALDSGGVVKFALVRLLSGGSIDPGFTTLFAAGGGGEASANAVASQADGKVVAAGYGRDNGIIKLALARRLGSGAPDTEFGNPAGIVLASIGDGQEAFANALSIQPDGKLLVAGSARDGGASKVLLARFNPDGTPDGGFGSGGTVLSAIGDGDDVAASALALQADGRIVVAGHATDSGGTNLLVARYNADGSPDASFGTGGLSLVPLGDDGTAEANALALQGARAVVTGYASDGGQLKTVIVGLALFDLPTPGAAPDTTPPILFASLTHKRFRVGRGRSPFGARRRRAPVGTAFRYRLSEAARVTITIQRARPGIRRGKRCVKPRRRRGRRCTRFVRVGRLVRESPQGRSRVRFNGRIRRRALRPGRYRAVLGAVDAAGNKSVARKLRFKVVRR
jgi:uncharacterized delta-60 repeat protein